MREIGAKVRGFWRKREYMCEKNFSKYEKVSDLLARKYTQVK